MTQPKPDAELGRPPFEFDLDLVRKTAETFATYEEIAFIIGCSISTLQRKRQEDPAFEHMIQHARAVEKVSFRRDLMKMARKDPSVARFMAKNLLGYSDKVEHSGPDGGPIDLRVQAAEDFDSAMDSLVERAATTTLPPEPDAGSEG